MRGCPDVNRDTPSATLTAMYVADTETVEAVGTTAIIDTYTDTENKKLTFVSMSTVPEGCSIDLAGILATDNETIANGTFDETSDGVRIRGDAWTGTAYRYTWTKANVTAGTTWYVRAYLVYTDANGNQRKVYGDVTSLTMPDSTS